MNNNLITGGMQYQFWLGQMGVSRPEGYRWRLKGMVKTHRIGKTLFITQKAINAFWVDVEAGKFEGELHGCCSKSGNGV